MSKKDIKGIENKDCPCIYNCERHGNCIQCKEYHKKQGTKTYCQK